MRPSNIITSFLWFLIACFLCDITVNSFSYKANVLLVVANIYSYYRCISIWKSSGNSLLSLYTFFILYMCASNLGQSIISLFPYTMDKMSIYDKFNMQEILSALRFQLLCVSAMGLGTSFYVDFHECNYSTKVLQDYFFNTSKYWFPPQLLLKIVFFVAILLVFFDAVSYVLMRQTMGYMDAYTERQLAGIPLYMQLANWLFMLISFYFAYTKRYTKLIIVLFFVLVCIFMVCGNRSLTIKYLAFLMLLCPNLYPKYFARKYWFLWYALLVCFLSSLSLITSVRNDVGITMQLSQGNNSFIDMLLSSLSEMGGSAQTLIYTMKAIGEGFQHHLTEAYFTITAISSSKLCQIIGFGNEYLSLGEWVGDYAGIYGYGLGYSCVAEWYMNYGWFGCIFAGLYSYIITMFECIAYKNILRGSYLVPATLLTFLATQIFYARSTMFYSLFEVRFGFWLIVIYTLVQNIKYNDENSYELP